MRAFQQAQTQAVDQWSLYQAKSTKEHLAESNAEMIGVQIDLAPNLATANRTRLEARIPDALGKAKKCEKEKEEIRAEACLTVAIAMFGVTSLTKQKPLFLLAGTFAGFGMVFGLAGFLHGDLHPNWLAKLLG